MRQRPYQSRVAGFPSKTVQLKIPISILMLCKPWPGTPEEFAQKWAGLSQTKVTGKFQLDTRRVKSMSKLREVIALGGAVNVLPLGPRKQVLQAATRFEHGTKEPILALIEIEINKDIKNCSLAVLSSSLAFRDVITRNTLDLIAFFS
jgi:hypothetical protein